MTRVVKEVTGYLQNVRDGCDGGREEERVVELVYGELKAIAQRLVAAQAQPAEFGPTSLVHSFYERLLSRSPLHVTDRRHFFALAARAMQRLLVDEYRRRNAQKRGGADKQVTFDERIVAQTGIRTDLLDLDDALRRYSELDERAATVARLRLFGGLSLSEIAEVIETSKPTAEREWRAARAWLGSRLV